MTVKKKNTKNLPIGAGQKLLKFGGASPTTVAQPPATAAESAPAESAPAQPPPQTAGLSEEQMQKIAENKRKALERQQQKKLQSSTKEAPTPTKPMPDESPPSKLPKASPSPKPQEALPSPKPKEALPSPKPKEASPSPPPVRPSESPASHATPQKFSGSSTHKDSTPQKVAAPKGPSTPTGLAVGGRAVIGCGSKFDQSACGSWMQYNNIYSVRLNKLRSAAQAQAKSLWAGDLAPQAFVPEIQDYKTGADRELVLVGILFKQMKSRPNTIDQYKASGVVGGLPETVDNATEQYWSDDDALWLEDHTMRVKLLLTQERIASMVSGLVVAVRGTPTADGDFKMSSVCFPQAPEVIPVAPALSVGVGQGPFIACISGLKIGSVGADVTARRRAIEFLTGVHVHESDRSLSSAIKQVIICGGLFGGGAEGCSWRPTATSLEEVDATLVELASKVPVDVLPGRHEPTNLSFPQKAMLPHLFPRAQGCSGLRLASNPYEREVGGVRVLGHAGQPVDDVLRCSSISEPVHALSLTLEAMHLAPTAPDTLATQPFVESDPFVLDVMPHLLFSGGHKQASHEWRACAHGDAGTQCVCVPSFHDHPAIVLINLRDPRDVRVKEFDMSEVAQDAAMGVAA